MNAPAPIPAATLVLFRELQGKAPELLIVERAEGMAFAAGALVFPGGKIDPGDHAIAGDNALVGAREVIDPDDAAARVAAIRETIEESGVAVGLDPLPDASAIDALRATIHAGGDFAAALREGGWRLDLDMLVPFARWCPNFRETRSFDTRFYVARLPADAPEARVDATENVRLFWAAAQTVLDMAERGEARIIFPTRRNLERLAQFADFEAARDHAEATPVRLIQPWVEERNGVTMLCIPDDLGYPVTFQPMAEVRRG
ncbi:NUDIX domain-containing protein [Sphingomonas sp. LaA6.9]|uniref:NUDIX hydrolase n=1 Tax=Sphingomonas sp. LaA6.9 TaxID=2919914 RepID=UPI001F4F490F|nr:NUDIX domain-containing protein [Sphingomonas sp. LaA6.9]MCJ8158733.1 NUDIX domain-containing protein [Sphingomonas sp. LaA6.9]